MNKPAGRKPIPEEFFIPAANYLLLVILFMLGCAQVGENAKDYVGVKHGFFTVGMKQKFGPGGEKKSYCMVDNETAVIMGDSKSDVIAKAGFPDKIERNIEGYETWAYKDKKIKLFFDNERVKEWSQF